MTTVRAGEGSRVLPRPTSGRFVLRPVDPEDGAQVTLIHRWMNAPHVVAYWQTALPREGIRDYLRAEAARAHSRPFLAELRPASDPVASEPVAGEPVGYLELYRADLDPLASHYDFRADDLGIHLLIGAVEQTGRGLGTALIAAARDALLAGHPESTRVVAEPDVRNAASLRAFAAAGFEHRGELTLPDKTAALMVFDRKDAS